MACEYAKMHLVYIEGGHANVYSITHSRSASWAWNVIVTCCHIIFIKNTWAVVAAESCFLNPCDMLLCWGPKMELENPGTITPQPDATKSTSTVSNIKQFTLDELLYRCTTLFIPKWHYANTHIVHFNWNFYFDSSQLSEMRCFQWCFSYLNWTMLSCLLMLQCFSFEILFCFTVIIE